MTDTSRTDAYSHFLTRPVWPKAHRTRLEDEYQGSSAEELERESIQRGHHHPLKTSITSGNRPAGTSGAVYGSHRHPDDFDHVEEDADEELKTALEKHIGKQGSRISQEERDELLKTIKDAGKSEQVREDFKKLLDDPSIVISARDVKGLTPDFASKEGHAKMHGWARYIMPISEAELKGQNWEGKEEQEREAQKKKEDQEAENKKSVSQDGDKSADKSNCDAKPKAENGDAKSGQNGDSSSTQGDGKQSKNNNSESKSADETDKKGGKSATDQKTNREQDNGAEHGDSTDDMTPTERRFMDELIAEANAIAAFKNATGEPKAVSDPDGLSQVGYEIQVDDQFTPDNWVPRSDHLLRLTGKHPLNAEADLRHLWDAGMVTPVKYHYVRNHGSVPKLLWEHHTLEVFSDPPGLLSDPHEFTMDEIAEMKCVEIPVTIACDGNRRGEVNMIKRSGGFTWGSSGVSTCRWKGVLVRDILLACGLQDVPAGERWYLNYEGADEPSEGKYATSIPLAHALNPQNDVLLAYSINGRVLSPDHGYPIRSIIPGYVGGRQVKWLKKLWITKKPNDSHYHIWDNRVIPSFVTDKNSIEGKAFFHHPDTACNEQILQSVIARPSQGECIPLTLEECKQNDNIFDGDDEHSDDPLSKMYRVQGFAYNGGGNIVQRVELSLDGGRSWRYCFRKFLDEPLRHGEKYWTWVFWHVDVTIRELCQATELCVRAFDAYKNTQPEHISWNLMGMMNNAWYRLRGRTDTDPKTKLPCLTWKHPIAPGGKEGGWMKPSPEEQAKQEAASAAQAGASKEFTLEEVEKHNTEKDCWIILDGKVYDAKSVLAWHPGGASAIMTYAGKATAQATADYNAIHDAYAQKKTQEVLIGKLSDKGVQALKQDSERVEKQQKELAESRKPFALRPFKYFPATLVKRQEVSDDTRIYTFKLPDVDGKAGRLGLPICKHVQIASHWQDSVAMRPYTPIRPVLSEEEDGTFDLLIKTYFPEASPFPPGGTLGNYLDVLNVGEQIDINGPVGDITYLGKGEFEVEGEKYTFDKINLVAGGSGITPHWQLIHAILKEEDDKTQVSLIDSNKSIGDILLYKELQKYAEEHTDQFKLWMTLSQKPEKEEWKYSVGHLDEQMMRDHFFMPKDGERVGTFLCGPPGLIKHGAMPALKKIGFEEGKTVFGF